MKPAPLLIHALPGLPEVAAGTDLAALILSSLIDAGLTLDEHDVLVVAQKIVSKAEGRWVELRSVEPSARARRIAAIIDKDPRFVEVVLSESTEIVRTGPQLLITRHRLGFVMANAGVDRSNVGGDPNLDKALLLPRDPDDSADNLREAIRQRSGVAPAVIVSDSFGRPWRMGVVNIALGVAGFPAIVDLRGIPDRDGRTMQTTEVAIGDAVAAAAGLAMGEAAEGTPVVHVRGVRRSGPNSSGQALVRRLDRDLFR
jgi:coenzyme F420-0:L-glutamate ligase / coenzyme F420-1:gamma-L-glutamate ligase